LRTNVQRGRGDLVERSLHVSHELKEVCREVFLFISLMIAASDRIDFMRRSGLMRGKIGSRDDAKPRTKRRGHD